jgi:hypothetical protein
MHPKIADRPFGKDDPLPKMLASCECGALIDPETNIVLSTGSGAKVQDPLPIIKP